MPSWLSAESFSSYPPEGRTLAVSQVDLLRKIPVVLLPVFLVELKEYDWKFPIEQLQIRRRLEFVHSNLASTAAFDSISLPEAMDRSENVADPERFLAEISAYLWSSLQMDAYREAAVEFMRAYTTANPAPSPACPRLAVVLIGKGTSTPPAPLFQKLRSHGQIRTNVKTEGARRAIMEVVDRRAAEHPAPYAHWYVEGGEPLSKAPVATVSQLNWPALASVDRDVLRVMMSCIRSGSGPEAMQAQLFALGSQNLAASKADSDPRLQHFAISLLTDGSGTQIFSTTFVQWATREILRRAQPLTVLARFAPRQREQPFNAMIEAVAHNSYQLDPEGSLVDADMAAYYAFLEMMNLPGASDCSILVWYEDHPLVFVAGPKIPKNTSTDSPCTVAETFSELLGSS